MSWVRVRATDAAGRLLELEVKVKLDVVEWWLGGRAVAMMDRERLTAWLAAPEGTFAAHEVSLWLSRWGPVIEIENRAQPSLLGADAFDHLLHQLLSQ